MGTNYILYPKGVNIKKKQRQEVIKWVDSLSLLTRALIFVFSWRQTHSSFFCSRLLPPLTISWEGNTFVHPVFPTFHISSQWLANPGHECYTELLCYQALWRVHHHFPMPSPTLFISISATFKIVANTEFLKECTFLLKIIYEISSELKNSKIQHT